MRITPERITELESNEIFVFGSNSAGHHGGGAARLAYEKFGARWGQATGLQGRSYAIPTMFGSPQPIQSHADTFTQFAEDHPELVFLVTEIGCGIAGFTPAQIAPMFARAARLENVALPQRFRDVLES